jgi:hypothetical protein
MPSKKRKKQRRIKPKQARRALYFDFEGRKEEGPVLLGVLFDEDPDGSGSWVLKQFVVDDACTRVDDAIGGRCEAVSIEAALEWLIDFSDIEERHLISWSIYDRDVAKGITAKRSFRHRNTIPTAKRWRREQREEGTIDDDGTAKNRLKLYESFIGYERPHEDYGVGNSIGYIRELKSVTPVAVKRWETILTHNEHDLLAMREVMFTVLGLTDDE